MNCKHGDLAIIVGTDDPTCEAAPEHYGKIVRCVELVYGDSWICEPDLETEDGCPIAWVDSTLRPLPPLSEDERDQAEAGKPEQVAA